MGMVRATSQRGESAAKPLIIGADGLFLCAAQRADFYRGKRVIAGLKRPLARVLRRLAEAGVPVTGKRLSPVMQPPYHADL